MKKYIFTIPLLIVVSIVPFLTRGHLLFTSEELHPFSKNWTSEFDLFTWWKAQVIVVCGFLSFLSVLLYLSKQKISGNSLKVFIPALCYATLIIGSSCLSKYPHTAWFGMPESNQGALVLLSYLSLMLSSYIFFREEKSVKLVLVASMIAVLIVFVFGLMQFLNPDYINQISIIRKLFIGNQIGLDVTVNVRPLNSTMPNSNHLGAFAAISLPLLAVFTILSVGKSRILGGFALVCCFFLLGGSESRGSWMAVAISLVIFFSAYRNTYLTKKRLCYFFVTVILFLGFIFPNVILNKIASVKNEIDSLYKGNYLSKSDLQHFSVQNGEVNIVSKNVGLKIKEYNAEISFQTLDGKNLHLHQGIPLYEPQRIFDGNMARIHDEHLVSFEEPEFSHYLIDVKFDKRPKYMVLNTDKASIQLIITEKGIKAWEWGVAFDTITPRRIHLPVPDGLFSGRAYIWSVAMPLLQDCLFLGKGPATFINYFPQKDLFGKALAGWTPNIVVDRPHNNFLQIFHATGFISLACFLFLLYAFLAPAYSILFQAKVEWDQRKLCLLGSFTSTIAYLINACFNDSAVGFAPLFWVSFGMGLGLVHVLSPVTEKVKSPVELPNLGIGDLQVPAT